MSNQYFRIYEVLFPSVSYSLSCFKQSILDEIFTYGELKLNSIEVCKYERKTLLQG